MTSDADWAFARYEAVRGSLPVARFPARAQTVAHLGELARHFDAFLLDAFGVLNIGETVVPDAPERIAALQDMGKRVLVVTNGASLPPDVALAKYRKLGFDFAPEDIVASRDALALGLHNRPQENWGVMAINPSRLEELPVATTRLDLSAETYTTADGFILLGSGDWSEAHQNLLVAALQSDPRPVLVGNPDIVAPREHGLTLEPGWFAHDLHARTGVIPEFYGKPFANVYDLALSRLDPAIPKSRIAMVGDTLHTDILGGAAAGLKTVLILNHGLFSGKDITPYIARSGIVPDYIAADT